MAYIKATNLRCAFALGCSVSVLGFTECGVIRVDEEIHFMRYIMRFRKLRIAWSVGCTIACVLLIVLWVRSYRCADDFGDNQNGLSRVTAFSARGRIVFWVGETRAEMDSIWYSFPLGQVYEIDKFAAGWGFGTFVQNRSSPSHLNRVGIKLPYWFAMLVPVALAAVPWIRWRFSLRTLLIATTLVAVVLGLIVYVARQ